MYQKTSQPNVKTLRLTHRKQPHQHVFPPNLIITKTTVTGFPEMQKKKKIIFKYIPGIMFTC